MLYGIFVALYVLVCVFLLIVVLLQQGKGGDIAAAFGGSSSQTAFGARAGATVLTRATTVAGALFMIGSIVLGVLARTGGSSVMSGVSGPAPAAATPTSPALPAGASQQPGTPVQVPQTAPATTGKDAAPAAAPKDAAKKDAGKDGMKK